MSSAVREQAKAVVPAPVATRPELLAIQPQLAEPESLAEPRQLAALRPLTMEHSALHPAYPRTWPFGDASYIRPAGIQAKPRVSVPGDPFEQEADRVAEAVMQMSGPVIQRQECPTCSDEPEDALIQRQAATPAMGDAAASSAAVPEGGRALPGPVQDFFGSRFSAAGGSLHDFSRVRIHTGPQADAAADAVNARAYTLGHDIVFAAGEYAPHTDAGRRLLAHELTHVIQQRPGVLQRDPPGSSGSTGSSGSSGPSVSMPSMTSLLFRYGDLRLQANLPTEVVATLPVELRNVGTLTFSMTADIPNNFSLAITLDTEPDIRIRTQVGYNRETGNMSVGLVVQSTRKTCTIPNATAVQEQLQAAGQRATTALQNFLNPPAATPLAPGESGPVLPPEIDRAVELGSAIGDLYSKAKAAGAGQRCIVQPVWSIDFGARIPVNPPSTGPDIFGPSDRERAPQPYFGLGFTYHF
jgi:hypothetical protein